VTDLRQGLPAAGQPAPVLGPQVVERAMQTHVYDEPVLPQVVQVVFQGLVQGVAVLGGRRLVARRPVRVRVGVKHRGT